MDTETHLRVRRYVAVRAANRGYIPFEAKLAIEVAGRIHLHDIWTPVGDLMRLMGPNSRMGWNVFAWNKVVASLAVVLENPEAFTVEPNILVQVQPYSIEATFIFDAPVRPNHPVRLKMADDMLSDSINDTGHVCGTMCVVGPLSYQSHGCLGWGRK